MSPGAIVPGAEPWRHDGAPDAPRVLVCHGFTGSPFSLLPQARAFAAAGMSVRLPLLPGHGSRWQDLARTRWPDWYDVLERELLELTSDGGRAAVLGLSMGGALALRLAERLGDRVSGLVLVNPAVVLDDWRLHLLPLLQHVRSSAASIGNDIARGGNEHGYDRTPLRAARSQNQLRRDVEAHLDRVTCPILLLTSRVDHVVPTRNGDLITQRVASPWVERVWLERSWHVATLDHDSDLISQRAVDFVGNLP